MDRVLLVMMLKNLVILPFQEIKLELKDGISKNIIKLSGKKYNDRVLVVSPKSSDKEPSVDDLPSVGVVAYIKSTIELANGNIRVTLKGEKRVKVLEYEAFSKEIIDSIVTDIELPILEEKESRSVLTKLRNSIDEYISSSLNISNSIVKTIQDKDDINFITDVITTFLPLSFEKKQAYMEEINGLKRAYSLINDINLEIEYNKLDEEIDSKVQLKLEKEQEEFYLKEKLKEIEKLLGNKVDNSETSQYYKKLKELSLEEKTKNKLLGEIKRLESTNISSPEYVVIKNYLDWILGLPWNISSNENLSVKSVINSLNKSHYGLLKIKDRIEDYINIKNINEFISSPIICLVGPPGIGKTTITSSIAKSLNREFYKISVGGLNDSTELVGNRRTYLGALPGKLIQGIKKCGTNNPVILIDEIDKMVKDYKGDPASTLLEILDSNQNKTFVDNYLEEPFDLSNVFFVLTANDLSMIPYPLYDRLEIIELSSYTSFEKVDIAKKYLIPKIIEEFNITKKLNIKDDVLSYIIDNYTSESGVRNLERILRTLITKIITNKKTFTITVENVIEYLDKVNKINPNREFIESGIVNGLAYTNNGGTTLQIEASIYTGEENIIVTGSIGDIIKESVSVAISYIKEKEYVSNTMFYNHIIHVHLLDAATKKEGPSCGVAITSAILSKLLDIPVSREIAFTGEVTLKGRILQIGGLKDKLIAAFNSGIKTVYIPQENQFDLLEIPEEITKNLEIKLVNNFDNIYDDIFRKNINKNN